MNVRESYSRALEQGTLVTSLYCQENNDLITNKTYCRDSKHIAPNPCQTSCVNAHPMPTPARHKKQPLSLACKKAFRGNMRPPTWEADCGHAGHSCNLHQPNASHRGFWKWIVRERGRFPTRMINQAVKRGAGDEINIFAKCTSQSHRNLEACQFWMNFI